MLCPNAFARGIASGRARRQRGLYRTRGTALFASYSPNLWDRRPEWFRIQAEHGLVGKIHEQATGDGVIVCKDRLTASTVSLDEFKALSSELGLSATIAEVDDSGLFCEIVVS